MNAPRFYINEGGEHESILLRNGCRNTIWALRTFTGRRKSGAMDDGSACKDPIDCLKAGAKADIKFWAEGSLGWRG